MLILKALLPVLAHQDSNSDEKTKFMIATEECSASKKAMHDNLIDNGASPAEEV